LLATVIPDGVRYYARPTEWLDMTLATRRCSLVWWLLGPHRTTKGMSNGIECDRAVAWGYSPAPARVAAWPMHELLSTDVLIIRRRAGKA
jgi:hypothetical protein